MHEKREYLLRHRKVHSTRFLSGISGILQPTTSILPYLCSSIPLPLYSWRNCECLLPTAICWRSVELSAQWRWQTAVPNLGTCSLAWRFDDWRTIHDGSDDDDYEALKRQQQRRRNGAQKKSMGRKEGRGDIVTKRGASKFVLHSK